MMKISLRKQIHGCLAASSSEDRWLKKDIELDFTPFVGLYISSNKGFEETITEVFYDLDEKRLVCYTEEDKELYHNADGLDEEGRRERVAKIVAEHISWGWEEDK